MQSSETTNIQVNYNHLAEAIKYQIQQIDERGRQTASENGVNYPSLRFIDWSASDSFFRIKNLFANVLGRSKLNFPFKSRDNSITYDIDSASTITVSSLTPATVVVINQHYYMITHVSPGQFTCFPEPTSQDNVILEKLSSGFGSIQQLVPFYDNLSQDTIEKVKQIASEISALDVGVEKISDVIGLTDYSQYGDTFLQIGDIIFLVDPTQLSFSTTNGYQYFPTLRTAGNPKIPTIQQIKDISISLIFPNQDSINYQLLPLFAMFKRTPFVNVRNRDVCDFFKEISIFENYISVALESISIQSIEGFPNTLQTQLTLLPFDPRILTEGFQALKSLGDVVKQQAYLFRNRILEDQIRKSETLLHEDSVIPSSLDDLIAPVVDKTPNFRESAPFRAFYQALIKERSHVLDEVGNTVKTSNGNVIDLTVFRPTKEGNFLHHYESESNQIPVAFTYKYIKASLSDASKLLSKERREKDKQRISDIRNFMNSINSASELLDKVLLTFKDTTDFYEKYKYRIGELDNIVQSAAARHGLDIDGAPIPEIRNFWGFLYNYLNPIRATEIPQSISAVGQVVDLGKKLVNGQYENDTSDILGLIKGNVWDQALDDSFNTGVGVTTIQKAVDDIYSYVSQNDEKKEKFSRFLEEMSTRMRDELNTDLVVFDPQLADYRIDRLPLAEETIVIDNVTDIITGWSIQYSNKFVSVALPAYRYPLYQHMGMDDVSLSLNIVSASNGTKLKSRLSRMSDRLYDSIKVITLTAPELMVYLDTRLSVTAADGGPLPFGNLFNVFGINKVVYNSSNTTNVKDNPDSWNTVLGLTQANFTLSEYHAIESVETSEQLRRSLFNILLSIVKENNNIVVYKYKVRSPNSETANIANQASQNTNISQQDSYIEVTDDDTITKLSYLFSPHVTDLAYHIDTITANSTGQQTVSSYDAQLNQLTRSIVIREKDTAATSKLQSLMRDYPGFANVINYALNIIDKLFKDETDGIKLLIQEKKTFWQEFKAQLFSSDNINGALKLVGGTTGTILIVSSIFMSISLPIFIGVLASAGIVGIVGGSIGTSKKNRAIQELKDRFSPFFNRIVQDIRKNTVSQLASKIATDPVILKKIINAGLLKDSNTIFDIASLYNTIANCYNDFDFQPIIATDGISQYVRLTPDFYLYNDRISDNEALEFVDESLDRYLDIGRLTSMAGLIETSEAMSRFDEIERNISATNTDTIHSKVKSLVYTKNDYESSIAELQDVYRRATYAELTFTDDNVKNAAMGNLNDTTIASYMSEYDRMHPKPIILKYPQYKMWEQNRNLYLNTLKSRNFNDNIDPAKFKTMVIYAARAKELIELYEVYLAINTYLQSRLNAGSQSQTEVAATTRNGYSVESLSKFYLDVSELLKNADAELSNTNNPFFKKVMKDKLGTAGDIVKISQTKVGLPDINQVEHYLYNKMGYYIRLNNAVKMINSAENSYNTIEDVLSTLPELSFLQYWNIREREALVHRLEILKDYMNSHESSIRTTLRFFPTYKIYFIEEDTGVFNQLDDFYAYNAIQSIEVTSNKNSASNVARIILSNVTGTITDKMSFLREQSDTPFKSLAGKSRNAFFGTLDVKPGTSIMIKMGYAANDKDLPIVFIGRIVEMGVGPVCEIIAQSYSAQLNHDIIQQKFGMLGTVKAYGDVASAILDLIPGLEKLGKTSSFNTALSFDGKNVDKYKGSFGDRFLISNLMGSVSALAFAQTNPRDENIYLPYDLCLDPFHKPSFDWHIYNQTVWESLQELCLYNRNSRPLVRLYNDDYLSSKNSTRQTLVVGDKSGYYKYTDSFSLSSIDYGLIQRKVGEYQSLLELLKSYGSNIKTYIVNRINPSVAAGRHSQIVVAAGRDIKQIAADIFSFSFLSNFYKFLCSNVGTLILSLHIIKSIRYERNSSVYQDLLDIINIQLPGFSNESSLISNAMSMSSSCSESDTSNIPENIKDKLYLFANVLGELQTLLTRTTNPLSTTLNPEDFYIINPMIKNTDESLIYKPNYRKIQQHHLITDQNDIINNNITLTSTFGNAINLYYPPEPTDDTTGKLNVWRILAFGNIRDEHIRPINTFQKNINTSWYEINRSVQNFFEGFKHIQDPKREGGIIKLFKNNTSYNANGLNFDSLPAFWVVGVSLLQKEVEKMYQGTIEIVGNPNIHPYDIVHISDSLNDMHGAIEVEEVTHVFTPDTGYKTVIVPNLITHDRCPIQTQDIGIINRIYDFANTSKTSAQVWSLSWATLSTLGSVAAIASHQYSALLLTAPIAITAGYNGLVGVHNKYHKFMYDSFGKILGRDCINFSSLIYHNAPYVAGFDSVDYTNLKSLINYKVEGITNPITRFTSFTDPWAAVVTTNWKPENYGIIKGMIDNQLANPLMPYGIGGIPTDNGDLNVDWLNWNL